MIFLFYIILFYMLAFIFMSCSIIHYNVPHKCFSNFFIFFYHFFISVDIFRHNTICYTLYLAVTISTVIFDTQQQVKMSFHCLREILIYQFQLLHRKSTGIHNALGIYRNKFETQLKILSCKVLIIHYMFIIASEFVMENGYRIFLYLQTSEQTIN